LVEGKGVRAEDRRLAVECPSPRLATNESVPLRQPTLTRRPHAVRWTQVVCQDPRYAALPILSQFCRKQKVINFSAILALFASTSIFSSIFAL
jgi:hypothetical protein